MKKLRGINTDGKAEDRVWYSGRDGKVGNVEYRLNR